MNTNALSDNTVDGLAKKTLNFFFPYWTYKKIREMNAANTRAVQDLIYSNIGHIMESVRERREDAAQHPERTFIGVDCLKAENRLLDLLGLRDFRIHYSDKKTCIDLTTRTLTINNRGGIKN
jgi:hypothetical protein